MIPLKEIQSIHDLIVSCLYEEIIARDDIEYGNMNIDKHFSYVTIIPTDAVWDRACHTRLRRFRVRITKLTDNIYSVRVEVMSDMNTDINLIECTPLHIEFDPYFNVPIEEIIEEIDNQLTIFRNAKKWLLARAHLKTEVNKTMITKMKKIWRRAGWGK